MELLESLYSNNYNSFNEWFELAYNNESVYPFNIIPYREWLDEYISDIENKGEKDIKNLLRILLKPYTRPLDNDYYSSIYLLLKEKGNIFGCSEFIEKNNHNIVNNIEMYKRIENGDEAWEGLTWILQLLPFKPFEAIRALNNYMDSEVSCMPDDRIIAKDQCIEIIEEKYILNSKNKNKADILIHLKPREFEYLIEKLYQEFGFDTVLTNATRDGGKDIIASINRVDGKEKVYIECKLYSTTKLKKESVRALYGVMCKENINRGVMYCTGYVSDSIRNYEERIQIFTLEQIIVLLNAHMGSNWDERLDNIIERQRKKYGK